MSGNKVTILDHNGSPISQDGMGTAARSQLLNSSFGFMDDTGINSGRFRTGVAPNHHEYEALYTGGSDLSTTIVNKPVNEALRYWRKFTHKDPEIVARIAKSEEKYRVKEVLRKALYDSRLYGGSVIIPIFEKEVAADELREPLDYSTIKKDSIIGYRHLDRWSVFKIIEQTYDPLSPDFMAPRWMVLAYGGFPINLTRMVKIDGDYLPIRQYQQNNWWGKSALQDVYQLLLQIGTLERTMAELARKSVFDVFKLQGLKGLVGDPAGMQNLKQRMDCLNKFQSWYKVTPIDGEDDWDHHETNFTSFENALNIYYKRLAGATNIPLSKLVADAQKALFGNSATSTQSDDESYNTMIEVYQTNTVKPTLDMLDEFILRNEFGEDYDTVCKGLSWEFNKPKFEDAASEAATNSVKLEQIQALMANNLIDEKQAKDLLSLWEIVPKEVIDPEAVEKEMVQVATGCERDTRMSPDTWE